MRSTRAWFSAALLLGACAIPNIEIVDSLDTSGGTSSATSGTSNSGGTKSGQGGSKGTPPDEAGAGVGGEPEGGTTSEPGGGTGGAQSTGGTGSPPARTAVGKFCNAVVVAGQPVSLDLRVGEGANVVHIVAESGTCSPIVGRDCTPIFVGDSVTVSVYDLSGAELAIGATEILPGSNPTTAPLRRMMRYSGWAD